MKLHHLKPAEGSKQKRIRVGRGDRGRGGKTAGRGTKGTGARGTVPVDFEGGQMPLKRRQPKLPGFQKASKARRQEVDHAVVNVAALEAAFEAGDEVTIDTLRDKGLVQKRVDGVKVLGHGDLTKRLAVRVDAVSGSAREKIESAGGSVETTAQ